MLIFIITFVEICGGGSSPGIATSKINVVRCEHGYAPSYILLLQQILFLC